jgi:hypothetical protein
MHNDDDPNVTTDQVAVRIANETGWASKESAWYSWYNISNTSCSSFTSTPPTGYVQNRQTVEMLTMTACRITAE